MKNICFFFTLALAAVGARAATYYVDAVATGANNGSSWSNAFTSLQSALDVGAASQEIRVAKGIYKPTKRTDAPNPRTATFSLGGSVTLKGGYVGVTSPTPDARDVNLYKTIL